MVHIGPKSVHVRLDAILVTNCRSLNGLALDGVVYSQPADTGKGSQIGTQLVYLVDFLQVCPKQSSMHA